MATEAYRGFLRIACNYGRLFSTLVIGLIYVPILLLWLGEAGFGLLSLIGASVGIAAMANEVSTKSMLRELGAAHHGKDPRWFITVYNSAFAISLSAACVTLIGFGILWALLPLLNIPDELRAAAGWLVIAEGITVATRIVLSPVLNMYVVTERFLLESIWVVLRRFSYLLVALILYYGLAITDPATALKSFAFWNASAQITVLAVSAAVMILLDPRLVIRPIRISREGIRQIWGTFGIQTLVTIAMNIHDRIAQIIVNLVFGVLGNSVYGVALRLSAYIRMTSVGMTTGLEAVSARLSADENRSDAVRELLHHMTRLHAFITIPAALAVFVLAEPLITLWVGRALDDPQTTIPLTVMIVQIVMFAFIARSLSDGWIAVMYGAGHLRRYAPLVITGGLVNPVLAGMLLWMLPEGMRLQAPALSFAMVLVVFHLLILPAIAARCFDLTYAEVVSPMLRPTIVALLCGVVLVYGSAVVTTWTVLNLLLVGGAYGGVYAIASWLFTLSAAERKRFGGAGRRRIEAVIGRVAG